MAEKADRTYSRDPFYDWLVREILLVFEFLSSEWGMKRKPVAASVRGCWVSYEAAEVRIQVGAEMGGRPECDLIASGIRQSLKCLIEKRWPASRLPPRPEYDGIEREKLDFSDVLRRYAVVLRDHRSDLLKTNTPDDSPL